MLQLGLCPYRLLFRRPFGTSHGLRDGTDSLFLRLEGDGVAGYGEITLPPYLKETIPAAIERITAAWRSVAGNSQEVEVLLADDQFWRHAPASRAGFQMAWTDWLGKKSYTSDNHLYKHHDEQLSNVVMTLGIGPVTGVADKLAELPTTGALKLKVGDVDGLERVKEVCKRTDALILLDGNQGLTTVDEAVILARTVGSERLLGFEQPFQAGERAMNKQLHEATGTVVYGDESIQGLNDLEANRPWFGGVNIKLMKCGGLDRARSIAKRARELGLNVMLGSMSESSLGCTAMAHLGAEADILDLDGPWLITNDPFRGIRLEHGKLVIPDGPGLGAEPVIELDFNGA